MLINKQIPIIIPTHTQGGDQQAAHLFGVDIPAYKQQRGFTLIELAVVLTIALVLAVIVFPSYKGSLTNARYATAEADAQQLLNAAQRHFFDNGSVSGFCSALPFTQSPRTGEAAYRFSCSRAVNAGPSDVTIIAQSAHTGCRVEFEINGQISKSDDCIIITGSGGGSIISGADGSISGAE